ncbi:MAG: GDSL-type esterase/lipase family protein [Candidatus Omnitrophica bacterium]|nr:GDSL-type esterase/lipase family protein [Candidatus Omnitrophota bacterium]
MKKLILFLLIIFGLFYSNLFSENNFPLKDGDIWVFLGDSITAQKLHTNYFEGFCFTRFPEWNIHFRNSGVAGDTILKALARFNWDVALWKPTIVSIELGMNDSVVLGFNSVSTYISRMETIVNKIKEIGAIPIIFSPSPVNDGSIQNKLIGRNITLDKYTIALEEFSKKNNIIFANQFHFLLDLWGRNKPIEEIHRLAVSIRKNLENPDLPSSDLLKKWIEEWEKSELSKKGIDIGGDPIHPGPVGQLMMCTILLEKMNAPKLVSKCSIDISNKKIEAVQCKISNLKIEEDKISFDRLDNCLPMPIPREAQNALVIYPQIADLSQWILKIENLKNGKYEVYIDGISVANVSSEELEKGWNMSTVLKGPVYEQCLQVLSAISAKENLVSEWRSIASLFSKMPSEEYKLKLQELSEKILQADKKIKEIAKPSTHNFVLSLIK